MDKDSVGFRLPGKSSSAREEVCQVKYQVDFSFM